MPVAVGRTAFALSGVADSGMVLRLTRGRLWIGLLGALLVGIVGLNVLALSFNAASSKTAATADQLRSENSALAADIAGGLSNERLQQVAARLGLVVPEPGAILYLEPQAGDAARAARRLRGGAVTVGSALAEAVVPAVAPPVLQPEPVAVAQGAAVPPAEPAESPAPASPAPAPPPAAAGGVALP